MQDLIVGTLEMMRRAGAMDNTPFNEGIDDASIAAYEARHNLKFPEELKQWSRHVNGSSRGHGVTLGLGNGDEDWDLSRSYAYHDRWSSLGWIPITRDDFGNHYIDTHQKIGDTHPVFLIDISELEEPTYVVASGIWRSFYLYFLEKVREDGESYDCWIR